ncbi:uncharacterized protein LOC135351036 [Halichondria panicea]|uniref:uncharacterized protein LOC135351036 n=1 Tax=Halichondria panicea TaxID=6063 RepID=UPI00312B3101
MVKCPMSHQCPTKRILASLIVVTFWLQLSQGASVNLTVEGGVDLVDEICPGIVTLFCEGVDINQLRWRYNGDTNIFMYSSDSSPSQSQPSQTFLSVELVAISQNTVDPDRANFTSILTADLSRLQSDNVMNIECGDAAIFQIESVNVQIIDRSRPRDPRFSMVTTEYQSKRLNSVQVQWRKSENFCPDYGLTFVYRVNLTAERSISINHDNCSNNFCKATFVEMDGEIGTIKLSVLAANELGSSALICYPYTIDSSAQQYFTPQVSFTNDQFEVECISTVLSASGQSCSVRYTTNPLFTGLSDEITSMLDTPFSIPGLSADTIYYFKFSLLVNSSLQIVDRISFIAQTSTGLPGWGIALIAIVVIFFGISTVIIFSICVLHAVRKKRKGNIHSTDNNNGCKDSQQDESEKCTDVLFNDDPARRSCNTEEVDLEPDQLVTRCITRNHNLANDMTIKEAREETEF